MNPSHRAFPTQKPPTDFAQIQLVKSIEQRKFVEYYRTQYDMVKFCFEIDIDRLYSN